ncbi:unnamed protein product [Heligmosomoides polygyrus]|uniref:Uncharacterized protein n=1 Tax=Heligmosomoides polygyrus TaxID=6339 RepID=A0A183FT74_HELPZ|nr:unnamed protein product [Heligmosomoides polygyrus]
MSTEPTEWTNSRAAEWVSAETAGRQRGVGGRPGGPSRIGRIGRISDQSPEEKRGALHSSAGFGRLLELNVKTWKGGRRGRERA